jgi:hypothetical protein
MLRTSLRLLRERWLAWQWVSNACREVLLRFFEERFITLSVVLHEEDKPWVCYV